MVTTQLIKLNVKSEYREKFQQALLENQRNALSASGNIAMRIYVDNAQPNVFFAYDRWQDKAALDAYANQPRTKDYIALTETALSAVPEFMTLADTAVAPRPPIEADKDEAKFDIFFIFKIKPNTRTQLLKQFEKHIQETRKEHGCLLFDLYTVVEDEATLVVYEHWRKASDVWDIHFNQAYAIETGKLMEDCVLGDLQKYMNFITQIA